MKASMMANVQVLLFVCKMRKTRENDDSRGMFSALYWTIQRG